MTYPDIEMYIYAWYILEKLGIWLWVKTMITPGLRLMDGCSPVIWL